MRARHLVGPILLSAVAVCAPPVSALPPTPAATPAACPARPRAIVVVVDGLRPDLITTTRMPTLAALGAGGVTATAHHSVFPTVTRVNAASLAAGTGPVDHGVLGNSIYLPAVSARVLNTGSADDMRMADSVLSGRLLTAPTIHGTLRARGLRSVVASAGSSGAAYLLAHGGASAIVNTELTLPASLHTMVATVLGAAPPDARPNVARNRRAVDALLRIGVDSLCSDLGFLWLSDPDHTTHGAGLGSALADSSLRAVDAEIARLLSGLRARDLLDATDLIVVSDHGFSTHAGPDASIGQLLAPFDTSIVVAGGAVYMRPGHAARRPAVIAALQRSMDIGAVFTRDGTLGTLRFEDIGWEHDRAGDVLFSADWSHMANEAGFQGSTRQAGIAGHGTSSPYDIGATFMASGPRFRRGFRSSVPTSNADVAPTVLALLGIDRPGTMRGRVAAELLAATHAAAPAPLARRDSVVAEHASAEGRYRVTLYRSFVGTTRYVDSTVTRRTFQPGARP